VVAAHVVAAHVVAAHVVAAHRISAALRSADTYLCTQAAGTAVRVGAQPVAWVTAVSVLCQSDRRLLVWWRPRRGR